MFANRVAFAMILAFGWLSVALEAGAMPASIGTSLEPGEAPIVKVDYYHPHYYRYRHDPHYGDLEDTPLALLTIPGRILGTVFGALAGDPYANPNFADPFYAPYRHDRYAYYGGDYWDRDDRYDRDYSSYEWPRYRRGYGDRDRFDGYDRPYSWDYRRSGYNWNYGRPGGWDYGRRAYNWDYGRPGAYAEVSYGERYDEDRPYREPYYSRWSYRDYGMSYSRSGEAACERDFRSFDPKTGTYVNYDGERVFCPYIHP